MEASCLKTTQADKNLGVPQGMSWMISAHKLGAQCNISRWQQTKLSMVAMSVTGLRIPQMISSVRSV